jgi:hypothetical protein
MTGVFDIVRAAILADGTLAALIENRVYSIAAPDDQKPPFITIQHSGNTPIQTAGGVSLEFPHITLNAYVSGLDGTTLKSIFDAVKALFDSYTEQSSGKSYNLRRIFDMAGMDEDRSLMWSFEYICTVTPS